MKNFCFSLILLSMFTNCNKDEHKDIEKDVQITIYAETGYGTPVLSDIWTEPILFSEDNDPQKQSLIHTMTEGLELNYERGYEYTFSAKKVWMHEPPQDVSSVKYVFTKLLSKKKVITKDVEEKMELLIAANTVRFMPIKYPLEKKAPEIYNALLVNTIASNERMVLLEIEGFDFEAGYKYTVEVKKITRADPYSIKYVLVKILSKQE